MKPARSRLTELHVEELVLTGVPIADREALRDAVRAALAEHLARGAPPPELVAGDVHVASASTSPIDAREPPSSRALADGIAGAVLGSLASIGLSGQGERAVLP
jgi:hypothetical protein